MEIVKIKQATKQGYALCEVGGWQILVTLIAKQGEEEYKETDRFVQLLQAKQTLYVKLKKEVI